MTQVAAFIIGLVMGFWLGVLWAVVKIRTAFDDKEWSKRGRKALA